MAHIIYDNDQPGRYNSSGYHGSSNNSYALLAIVILLVLFFWVDLGWLRANFDSGLRDNPNSSVMPNSRVIPVEGSTINPITGVRYVIADNLNVREQPGFYAQASYILLRGVESRFSENHIGNSIAMFGSK
jgi:hypothetical protein